MSTLAQKANVAFIEIRPYQLTGPRYAFWYDCGALREDVQAAVANFLCSGGKIVLPYGKLDERTKGVIRMLAMKRGVFIPNTAF